MAVRALIVVGLLVLCTACSDSDEEATPRATLATAVSSTATGATAPSTTAARPTTTAPTLPATTVDEAELRAELEAEIVEAFINSQRTLHEALLDPANADLGEVRRWWIDEAIDSIEQLLAERVSTGLVSQPGPQNLHYQDVLSVELISPTAAIVVSCNVTDTAVYDTVNGEYLDPGLLSSFLNESELRLINGEWQLYSDTELNEFEGVVGCDR